ncbi:sporulation protein Cse60 [Camelliibacillus cellulosilyticus]|uniref:Sporulation protein Cse60 n=1 Tax=Camelliibacillus cellulosilyticus TaxID=2174486 RepID=A0ABV9GJQ9_9BACL
MLSVKLFDENHELDLEEAINAFLQSAGEAIDVKDIQFRVAVAEDQEEGMVFCFSAMIVYERKERGFRPSNP